MPNAIGIIIPYRYNGTWVFDDPAVDLVREPFVAGVPQMIDAIVADLPGSPERFRLLFSSQPFPGAQHELIRGPEEGGGRWYEMRDPPMEGWLCPALFKYFDEAPSRLHVRVEAIVEGSLT